MAALVSSLVSSALLWKLAAGAVAAAAEDDEEGVSQFQPPRYDWPPFANWDCVGTHGILDWDALYAETEAAWQDTAGNSTDLFVLPTKVVDALYGDLAGLLRECPLGTLYFLVLFTYELISSGGGPGAKEGAVEQATLMSARLAEFPFFVIASARWPTYEALHYFSRLHAPQSERAAKQTLCDDVHGHSGVDWRALQQAAVAWGAEQMQGLEPGQGLLAEHSQQLKDAADAVYKNPQKGGLSAQHECPFGFVFLCTTQVMAASMRVTGTFEVWARALDKILSELPFYTIAGAQWPTFQVLAMMSSASKGRVVPTLGSFQADVHRWGTFHPVHKRYRQYGDLRLTVDELAPLGRTKEAWSVVDDLVKLSVPQWSDFLFNLYSQEKMRPIFRSALEAVLTTARAGTHQPRLECGMSGITERGCLQRGCRWLAHDADASGAPRCQREQPRRKVVGVTFVWGEKWAPLVPQFAAWISKLGLSTIIVAMGDACRSACESAFAALGGTGANVACWDPLKGSHGDPERGSILQRHAMVHLLLHLGVDALAFDFDTFWFSDARVRLESIAAANEADVLMTRHLDADCFNMGLLYIQASAKTAEWYSRYLEWLHQHPYEREQRGVNSLLGFTQQKVSFPPKNMPSVKSVALDDLNEFASSRGGWLGNFSELKFFHWVNPAVTYTHWGELKFADLRALYDAALHFSTADALARSGSNSFAELLATAKPDAFLSPIREIMNSLRVDTAPDRQACW